MLVLDVLICGKLANVVGLRLILRAALELVIAGTDPLRQPRTQRDDKSAKRNKRK